MRRAFPILLALSIWASSSGFLHLLHDHSTHGSVRHDESKCEVCIAHHAPLTHANAPLVSIELLPHRQVMRIFDHSIDPQRTPLTTSCRGPPVC